MYIYGGKDANGQTLGDFFVLENVTDFCMLSFVSVHTHEMSTLTLVATRASLLGVDFLKELKEAKFPDFEIISIDGKSIKAHRSMLAARNTFFRGRLMANARTTQTQVRELT